MSEENRFGPKNKWTRIFRKKWFFPSLYLVLAAFLISAVFWYQSSGTDQADLVDEESEQVDGNESVPVMGEEEAEDKEATDEEELVQMPVANQEDATIVTKFFDYDAEATEQTNALIHYNNRYYQSTGVAIGMQDEESFEVIAALSGTVEEVKEDPLMGDVVVLAHEDELTTYYASLTDVSVDEGEEIEQGDTIGQAGNNIFGKDNGTHVHFEMEKSEIKVNPEDYFDQPVANIEVTTEEAEEAESEVDEVIEEEQENELQEELEENEENEEHNPFQSDEEDVEMERESEQNQDEQDEDEMPGMDE